VSCSSCLWGRKSKTPNCNVQSIFCITSICFNRREVGAAYLIQFILCCDVVWCEVTTWLELEVASRLPSSLTEIVPILMMARLLHPSDYKHSTQNVPMPLLVLQAHCCQTLLEWNVLHVPWNSIWLGHHHRASGMHQSKCFSYSNEFASPVSTREVVQSQKSRVFMMPDDFSSFESIYFPCPCALPVKTSDRWGGNVSIRY